MTAANAQTGGVSLAIAGCVATILFDRIAARNAMLHATWRALPALIAAAEADKQVQVIVLRGAGGHFGAGNDIAEFGDLCHDAAGCRDFGWTMAEAMLAVERATKPVVAAIEGCCFGASVALALAADFRVAAHDARLAITPAKLGALYLRSDLHRLVASVGQGHARRMILTAGAVGAEEALTIGLIEEVLPSDRFDESLGALLHAILIGSPYTLRHSKRMLSGVGLGSTPPETEDSIGWFVDAMQGADFAEGITAFIEKRAPQFGA